jgi:hypothetical protein
MQSVRCLVRCTAPLALAAVLLPMAAAGRLRVGISGISADV